MLKCKQMSPWRLNNKATFTMATAKERSPEAGAFNNHTSLAENTSIIPVSTDNEGKQYICDLCEEDKRATYHCIECNQHLCDWCKKIHSRTKSAFGHSMVDIGLWDRFQSEVRCNNHPICPAHPNKVYHCNILCTNCMEIVCGTCRKDLRHPSRIPPIVGLPELSTEEKKMQELYLQLEYYKEVEKLVLLDQGVDTNKEPERLMMADKVKEFMRKFTDRIDKVRREMISQVNTHYDEEKQVALEYTYREKIDALEDKIEAYNQKLFDHSRAKYITAAQDVGVDLGPGFRDKDLEKIKERSTIPYQPPTTEDQQQKEKKEGGEKEGEEKEGEEKKGEEEKKEKPRRRCKSPVFEPGEVDESEIKKMIEEYLLEGETPDLIARQEALIRDMFSKLEYQIIEEGEDGTHEITKVSNLGRDIKVEPKEANKSATESTENKSEPDNEREHVEDNLITSGGENLKNNEDSAVEGNNTNSSLVENGFVESEQGQNKELETENDSVNSESKTKLMQECPRKKSIANVEVLDIGESIKEENISKHLDGRNDTDHPALSCQSELGPHNTTNQEENGDSLNPRDGIEKNSSDKEIPE